MAYNGRPELTIPHEIQGWGELRGENGTAPVASCTISRGKYAHDSDWTVVLRMAPEHWQSVKAVIRNGGASGLEFVGTTSTQRALRIPKLFWTRHSSGELRGFCGAFEMDVVDPPSYPSFQSVGITLSPTPLALPEAEGLLYQGTGEIQKLDDREPFSWETSVGVARLSRRYAREAVSVSGIRSSVDVPEPTLFLEMPDDARSRDTRMLHETLATELGDFTHMLGFLGRKPVTWVMMRIASHRRQTDGDDGFVCESEFYRRGPGPFRSQVKSPIVNPHRLEVDALDALYRKFVESPYREALYHAMSFLVGTFDNDVIARAVKSAWTALDTIVDGVSRVEGTLFAVDEESFKKVAKQIKKTITNAMPGAEYKPARRDMKEKLGELRTRPFVPRASEVIKNTEVEWRSLFPADTNLEKALRSAWQRRSALVHRGRSSAIRTFHADVSRIHALAERIVYRLLGGDPSWLHTDAYRHCHGLDQAPT